MSLSSQHSTGRVAVAVVEDDPHFRLFLESMLEASPRHRLVATAGSAVEALAWDPAVVTPHVLLVDVGLPDRSGAELVGELLARHEQALGLMLTAETDAAVVLQAVQSGANGYVLKGGREEDLLAAIDDALAGGAPMSPGIARKVLGLMRGGPTRKPEDARLAILTDRERDILERVAEGAVDKEIGDALGLSRSTVKNALLVIYQKWRVRSRTEAAVVFTRLREGNS
ncbi:response regulator [Actomonas aquatica]|uniref:Response regulator transcription factor n=1 Tax=Actomonas aquatica TaxID=2866162 RepID=A0ABZ1C6F8_9BACT|nr:response regulator transcription factor [Opitutus sp. WL0086]WRQ86973.1 response regulator transcription factor [Opitutus sp. WL0086]